MEQNNQITKTNKLITQTNDIHYSYLRLPCMSMI